MDVLTLALAKQYTDEKSGLKQKVIKVDSLPDVGEDGVIYLVPAENPEYPDMNKEYLYVDGSWELIGNVSSQTFTDEQWQAINSGITSVIVGSIADKQDKLIPGTGIDIVDNVISAKGIEEDNETIVKNNFNKLQAVGLIEQNNGAVNKTWIGTKEEYNAISELDDNTFYYITDDEQNSKGKVVEIGSYQYSYNDTILPAIPVDILRQVYIDDKAGVPQILHWTLYGAENNLKIVSSDLIEGEYSIDVLIHNKYHCEYKWNVSTTDIVNPSISNENHFRIVDELLATGVCPSGEVIHMDTGLKISDIKKYKSFLFQIRGATNVQLSNVYLLAGGRMSNFPLATGFGPFKNSGTYAVFEKIEDDLYIAKSWMEHYQSYLPTVPSPYVAIGTVQGNASGHLPGTMPGARPFYVGNSDENLFIQTNTGNVAGTDYAWQIRGLTV